VKVLFVCTANSCRSQMAETWARSLFPAAWEVRSAGLLTYRITSRTRGAMAEVGLDMSGQRSKTIDTVDLDDFDLIVTLSDEARRYLPRLARPGVHVHVPVDDPMAASGNRDEVVEAFRTGRDRIQRIVERVVDGEIRADRPR